MSVISYAVNSTKKQEYELGKRDFSDETLVGQREGTLFEILMRVGGVSTGTARRMAKTLDQMGIEFVVTDEWFHPCRSGCETIGSIWDAGD